MSGRQPNAPDSGRRPYVPRHRAARAPGEAKPLGARSSTGGAPYVPRHAGASAPPELGSPWPPGPAPSAPEPAPAPAAEPAPEQNPPAPGPAPSAPEATAAPAPSIARSTALMAVATLGSRATGLVRTWVMAYALGNGLIASSYQVANTMPNIIYELVAGGLLSAAFVPLYLLQTERLGKRGGDRYASNLLNIVVIVCGLLTLLATVFAEQLVATQTFTVGTDAAVNGYAVLLFRIFAVQLLFYGLGGVFTSILNANRVFFLPAVAPLFNNIVIIAATLAFSFIWPRDPLLALYVLGIGTTLGVVAQFAVQIPALVRLGFRYVPRIDLKDPALVETLKTGVPMVIYVVGTLVSYTFRNAFSLETGDNGPSTLVYAWTWFQLPHGIIAASLSRALFTEMSEANAHGDLAGFKHFMQRGISGTLLVVIPLAGLMFALSGPLIQVFRAGAFSGGDASYVSGILGLWVFALPCYSLQLYLFNVFASIRRFTLFSLICTALCVLQCALYALLCTRPAIGLAGVPIADFIYYLASTLILLLVLRRILGRVGGRALASTTARVLLATGLGVAGVWLASHFLPFGGGILVSAATVAGYGCVGLVVIFGLCRLMRVPEMSLVTELAGKVARRFRPGGSSG